MPVHITYFVHGTTTDNERGVATGWNPGVLSERGIRQAKELGTLVRHKRFDAVFCSDLQRAVDTVSLAFGERYPIIPDMRLREVNYGLYTNQRSDSFKGTLSSFVETPFPQGESYRDVERRMADFLRFLQQEYNGKQVAIVAHQAPQLALDALVKGKTWQQAIAEDWRHTKAWQPGWEYTL
ncbi:MAG: histidine phosphatase family protein [Candidatus Peribacteraceae bacterium]|jgi:broad specificity phosphatase PhoE